MIRLFGGLCASCGDRRVTRFRSQKTAALLAYLAYHHQRSHPRAVLIELLWPGCDAELGRHNLSVALSRLRVQLKLSDEASADGVFIADRSSVGMNAAAVTTDVGDFETAFQHAATAGSGTERLRFLSEAVDLYRGALLPGYYEEWILPEQQRLDELFFEALRQLIAHFEQTHDLGRALQYAQRAVRADPLREEAHQALIRLHMAAGQPSAALRQYRELERLLQKELGIAPSAATRRLLDSHEARPFPPALQAVESGIGLLPDRPTHRADVVASPAVGVDSSPLSEAASAVRVVRPEESEPVGGAVPLGSPFYVMRPADEQFAAAIARQDSIVLVKGPRQVGKTSLLARGLDRARQAGARVVLTDFAMFNAVHLQTAESLLLALAQSIAEQLNLDVAPIDGWEAHRGPNLNFRRYLRREVLSAIAAPVVWGLDEIDRLFGYEFSSEIFSMFRAWHNERALDPGSPWARLTLAIAYATEAHLFISDLNKSPFNVGTRLTLDDFTLEQIRDLNRRYGSPLTDPEDVARYYQLVGGHPGLVRQGLHHMVTQGMSFGAFDARADRDAGVFGDHLQRMLDLLLRDPELCEVVRRVLSGRPCAGPRSFYRLRTAGLLSGDSEADARPRCQLYAAYLQRHLL